MEDTVVRGYTDNKEQLAIETANPEIRENLDSGHVKTRLTREQQILVEKNTRLVYHVARKYFGYEGKSRISNEIFSAGADGLINSAQKWDDSYGCKFPSYAVYSIKSYIGSFIQVQNHYKTKIIVDDVNYNYNSSSLIRNIGEVEFLNDSDYYKQLNLYTVDYENNIIDKIALEQMISILTQRERNVVTKRLQGYSYKEIGDELGLTHQRIQQILEEAVKKIQQSVNSKKNLPDKIISQGEDDNLNDEFENYRYDFTPSELEIVKMYVINLSQEVKIDLNRFTDQDLLKLFTQMQIEILLKRALNISTKEISQEIGISEIELQQQEDRISKKIKREELRLRKVQEMQEKKKLEGIKRAMKLKQQYKYKNNIKDE